MGEFIVPARAGFLASQPPTVACRCTVRFSQLLVLQQFELHPSLCYHSSIVNMRLPQSVTGCSGLVLVYMTTIVRWHLIQTPA